MFVRRVREGLIAGAVGAVCGAVPSSLYGIITGTLLEPTLAAGSIVLPGEQRRARLVTAAAPVHLGLSLGWGIVLAFSMPRERPAFEGVAAGLTIAAVDLGIGRRIRPSVAELPVVPQVADHIAYGIAVAVTLAGRDPCRDRGHLTPRLYQSGGSVSDSTGRPATSHSG